MQKVSAYQDLCQTVATRSSEVVAFVGSGLSASAGLPAWPGLKAHLVEEMRAKAARAESPTEAGKLAERADSIARMGDFWSAFGRLEMELGKTTYQAIIRNQLAIADVKEIPSVYGALWRSPIKGVLSVNLDNFIKRSFSDVYPGRDLKWFIGAQAGRLTRLLHGIHPFAYSLHGSIDDAQSWVFTNTQLKDLYRAPGYRDMLVNVFSSYTVLFLGISADDMAVGGPLERLAHLGVEGPTHYWITNRGEASVASWTERVGIRVLPYAPIGSDHSLVERVLWDLTEAVGLEVTAPPVLMPSGQTAGRLPSPSELVVRPLDEIRQILNDRASEILVGPDGEKAFEEFLRQYEEAVHRAWFIPATSGPKKLFDYELGEQIARGAFGRVYRSTDPTGRDVAVKILLEEIRNDPDLLGSFRRGVQAMRILEKHSVPGMVTYEQASEVPAFVAMEWVEGPNLTEAKDAGLLNEWDAVLWVATDLVSVVRRAHDLPERVLHRDIRPANVMLRNGWLADADWEVVVLDFDLSTFRGARQKSVLAKESAIGFLAPEQLGAQGSKYSTRSAAVDSFGIGMTLYFLCSGREPEAYAQRRSQFRQQVDDATRLLRGVSWHSLPRRFARLIVDATLDAQPERLDVAQIEHELRRLRGAQTAPSEVRATDLLCEELAARCPIIARSYDWDRDAEAVVFDRPGGLSLRMTGAREDDQIDLEISWAAIGVEERSSISKYLPERLQRAAAALRTGPWEQIRPSLEKHSLRLGAVVAAYEVRRRLEDAARGLSEAVEVLQMTNGRY